MYHRLLEIPSHRSVLLLGPRLTGKSTLVQAQLPAGSWSIDLLQHDQHLKYAKEPGLFRREAEEQVRRGTRVIFVDDVQKVPPLLDEVHGLIERAGLRFILTGSSARKLRRGGANLLAGRATTLRLYPLVRAELGSAFDLDRVLRLGSLPAVAAASDDTARQMLKSYAETYLREEIQAESIVRNLGGFARFLDVAAAQIGDLRNVTAIARDVGLPARTVAEYFQILEDTLIGFRLEPWRESVRARLVTHPRFYFFDNGVTNALAHRLTAPPDPVLRGRLFEQWLVTECIRVADYASSEARFFFWRTNHGSEVDLLIEKHGRLVAAVEAKTSARIASADLAGLRSFATEHPGVPTVVVTPRALRHRLGDTLITGIDDFFTELQGWL